MTKTETLDRPKLVMATRCDASASGSEQAFTIWENPNGGFLTLCKHHNDLYEVNLTVAGWALIENRIHEINKTPSPSASVLAETAECPDDMED